MRKGYNFWPIVGGFTQMSDFRHGGEIIFRLRNYDINEQPGVININKFSRNNRVFYGSRLLFPTYLFKLSLV